MPMHPDKLFRLAAGRTACQRGCECVNILLMPVCAHLSLTSCLPLTCPVICHTLSGSSYPAFPILPGQTSAGALLRGGNLRTAHQGFQQIKELSAIIAPIGPRDIAPRMGGNIILRNNLAIAIRHTQIKLRFGITLFGKGLPRSKRGCKITTP